MDSPAYPIWDISKPVFEGMGLHKLLAADTSVCWVGSEGLVSNCASAFEEAFQAGDVHEISLHHGMGDSIFYVLGGTSMVRPSLGLLLLCKSNTGTMAYDEVKAIKEIAQPLLCRPSDYPAEAIALMEEITSKKAVWAALLKAFFR